MAAGTIGSIQGAVAGASVCAVPYATELFVNSSFSTGIQTGSIYFSSDDLIEFAMASGYTVTMTNLFMQYNEAISEIAGENKLEEVVGEDVYRSALEISKSLSDAILFTSLYNPDCMV